MSAIILITSCSSNVSSNENVSDPTKEMEVNQNWLQEKSDSIQLEGKTNFETLIPDYDSFENTGYYNLPKNENENFKYNKPIINFFLATTDTDTEFRFCPNAFITYGGEDWLFINSLYIKIGEEVEQFPSIDQIRNVQSGSVTEIVPISFDSEESILFLSKVFSGNPVEIRFGSDSPKAEDRLLTDKELKGLKKILLAYRYMYQNNLLEQPPKI